MSKGAPFPGTAPLQRLLGALAGALAGCAWRPWKNALIQWYLRRYRISPEDLKECAEPDPLAYKSFDAFFTRALKSGVRIPPGDPRSITSPVDGVLDCFGTAQGEQLLQAKGISYTISELLGDPRQAAAFRNGLYMTLYLAPGDYHRVHLPIRSRPQTLRYLPGRLFSVQPSSVARRPRLYSCNERLAALFDTAAGRMALVMVGALCVGRISVNYPGFEQGMPRRAASYDISSPAATWERCHEFGVFHMGSCVILLFEPGSIYWQEQIKQGERVRMASPLGKLRPEKDPFPSTSKTLPH